jgi:hypothetical protein
MSRSLSDAHYERLREKLAPYVNVTKRRRLRPSDKAILTRYSKALFGGKDKTGEYQPGIITGHGDRVVRYGKRNAKAVNMALGNQNGGLPRLKGVIVNDLIGTPKVNRKGQVTFAPAKGAPFGGTYYPFEPYDRLQSLEQWVRGEIERVLAQDNGKSNYWRESFANGLQKVKDTSAVKGKFLADEVVKFANRYASREVERWLNGVTGYNVPEATPTELESYLEARQAQKKEKLRKRKKRKKT